MRSTLRTGGGLNTLSSPPCRRRVVKLRAKAPTPELIDVLHISEVEQDRAAYRLHVGDSSLNRNQSQRPRPHVKDKSVGHEASYRYSRFGICTCSATLSGLVLVLPMDHSVPA
jgi:hypothetical protein